MNKLLVAAIAIALPVAAQAGAIKTDIRRSRGLPEMEATAVWMAPRVATAPAAAPVAAAPGSVLYSEAVTLRQLAGTIDEPLTIAGAHPVAVPAGALFSGWWAGGEQRACTSLAEDSAKPGKPAYQLCLTSHGGNGMDHAIIRALGTPMDAASTVPLPGPVTIAALKVPSTEQGYAWPRSHIFSYRQDGGVGIITEYNRTLLAPEMSFERRLVVRKIAGTTLTLRCEDGARDDLSKPVALQKGSYYKIEERDVDLLRGPADFSLCGGRFALTRVGDDMVSVTASAPFAPWWSLDDSHRDFRLRGQPYVYGAQ